MIRTRRAWFGLVAVAFTCRYLRLDCRCGCVTGYPTRCSRCLPDSSPPLPRLLRCYAPFVAVLPCTRSLRVTVTRLVVTHTAFAPHARYGYSSVIYLTRGFCLPRLPYRFTFDTVAGCGYLPHGSTRYTTYIGYGCSAVYRTHTAVCYATFCTLRCRWF